MDAWEEERVRWEVVFAPLRLLAGLVSGAILAILAFGIAWRPFWPTSFEAIIQAIAVLGMAALVAAGFGAFMFAIRPIRRWWQLIVFESVGIMGAPVIGSAMRAAVLTDCLHGSGPQERWCSADYSFLPFFLGTTIACAIVAGVISVVGIRPPTPRIQDDGERPFHS
jgi:hypothetical protein